MFKKNNVCICINFKHIIHWHDKMRRILNRFYIRIRSAAATETKGQTSGFPDYDDVICDYCLIQLFGGGLPLEWTATKWKKLKRLVYGFNWIVSTYVRMLMWIGHNVLQHPLNMEGTMTTTKITEETKQNRVYLWMNLPHSNKGNISKGIAISKVKQKAKKICEGFI